MSLPASVVWCKKIKTYAAGYSVDLPLKHKPLVKVKPM